MIITRDNKEINNLSSVTPWSVLQFVLVSPCLHSTWKFVIVYPIRLIETSELARIEPILNFLLALFSGVCVCGVCVCVSCSSARNRIKKGFMDCGQWGLSTGEKSWGVVVGGPKGWKKTSNCHFVATKVVSHSYFIFAIFSFLFLIQAANKFK